MERNAGSPYISAWCDHLQAAKNLEASFYEEEWPETFSGQRQLKEQTLKDTLDNVRKTGFQ